MSILKIGEVCPGGSGFDCHYETVGLLLPAEVDRKTDYHLYSLDQLPRLHRLLVLKDLDFPWNRGPGSLRKISGWSIRKTCFLSNRPGHN